MIKNKLLEFFEQLVLKIKKFLSLFITMNEKTLVTTKLGIEKVRIVECLSGLRPSAADRGLRTLYVWQLQQKI